MKVCRGCKAEMPIDQYYKTKNGRNGIDSRCKPCRLAEQKEYYKKNSVRCRELSARWRKENRDRARELKRRWNAKNPRSKDEMNRLQRNWRKNNLVRAETNQALQRAVRSGKIEKPNKCEDCNKGVQRNILHGHHDDYSKPLKVNWLCPPCHGDRHIRVGT